MCITFFSYVVVKIDLINENQTQCIAPRAGNLTTVFHPWERNLTGQIQIFFNSLGSARPPDPGGNN